MSVLQNTGSMLGHATPYFGYGSNLWLHQMEVRCPDSKYMGVARLNGYRWMINQRGYANVVQISEVAEAKVPTTNVSYGLVFSLQETDEQRLDGNEGVPIAYTKEYLSTEFWPAPKDGKPVNLTSTPESKELLVYINRDMTQDDEPKREYIYRMNMGIKDAVKAGVPQDYVNKVLRKFIPEKDDGDVQDVAKKQALEFQEEI